MKPPLSHSIRIKSLVDRPVKGATVEYLGRWRSGKRFLFRQIDEDGKAFLLGVGVSRRVGSVRFHCPELKFPVSWNEDTECLAVMYRRQVRLYGIRERRLEVLGMRTLPHASPGLTWINDRLIGLAIPPVVLLDVNNMGAKALLPEPPIKKLRRPPRMSAGPGGDAIAYGDVQGCISLFWDTDFRKSGPWGEWDPSKTHHIHPPAFSADGKEMAVAPRPRGPQDTGLVIRIGPTLDNGQPVREVPAAFPMTSVAFAPDLKSYLAPMALGENRLGLFAMETAELIREFSLKEYPRSLHLAGGQHLVVTYSGGLTVYEVHTNAEQSASAGLAPRARSDQPGQEWWT
jgi:hypothetical protein